MTQIPANDPVSHALNHAHSAATTFTQNPDTSHLLVVPFDARSRHIKVLESFMRRRGPEERDLQDAQ